MAIRTTPPTPPAVRSTPEVRLSSARGRWVLAATVLGSALTMLTGTVVNVALPAIGEGLGADTAGLQWVLTGYLLALASLILVGGALGDRFGRRRVFTIGAVAFALATLLCGVAPNLEILIGFRIAQGVAGALLVPGSLAIIEAVFHPDDRGRAIGAWSALGGIAAAVGPVLGGWVVDVGSWRWVFYLNLPVAVAVVLVAMRYVPETRDPEAGPLDLGGAASIFVALGASTWALILATTLGPTDPQVWVRAGIGLAAFLAFLEIERRHPTPMIPLGLFRERRFAAANAVTFVVYGALGSVFFMLVVHLQVALGYPALVAGAALLPVTALMLLLSSHAGDWAQRRGARAPLTLGGVLVAAGMLGMGRIAPGDGYWSAVLPPVIVFGLGLAATVAPVTAAALAAVDRRRAGLASGVNNAVSRTAQLGAVAVVPWIAGLGGDRLTDPAALAAGFPLAMNAAAGVALAGGVLAFTALDAGPLTPPAAAAAGPTTPDAAATPPPARPCRHCAVDGAPLRIQSD